MTEQKPNPYASPSEGAQQSAKFMLDDAQRKLISSTATLMVIAGVVPLLVTVVDLVREGFTVMGVIAAALFGVVPAFVAIAGLSLRSAASQGSLEALLSGFRQLYVAFLVKGVTMLLMVGLGLLGLLMFVLGIGSGLAAYFGR
jgi:hypothetical protein